MTTLIFALTTFIALGTAAWIRFTSRADELEIGAQGRARRSTAPERAGRFQ